MTRTMKLRTGCAALGLIVAAGLIAPTAHAAPDGLLFYVSGDKGLNADVAKGQAAPNYAAKVTVQPDANAASGRGAYIACAGDEALSWMAPGNIYAQRGTLSFYWRARDPLGPTQFPLFRVGYADHTSWDMAWLRVDWNGHGFDAFVTDDNLARVRVSAKVNDIPKPDQWVLVTFAWDEAKGITLYIDGKKVGSVNQTAALDAGLDQFGPHSRTISPHQVHSMYQFIRGGDIDDIRIYDHALSDAEVAGLAGGTAPASAAPARDLANADWQKEWLFRYGWDRPADMPTYLSDAKTRIRKVEFADQFDLKERMSLGSDGIAETTWPGVYNRSKLPGRHDYFELPDWNVYVDGGKTLDLTLPNEPFNHIEFQGAAHGSLTYTSASGTQKVLAKRPAGEERTYYTFDGLTGGKLRFTNDVQETPIQEVNAFNITSGAEPDEQTLSYAVNASADAGNFPALDDLATFVKGRFSADERSVVVALPGGRAAVANGRSQRRAVAEDTAPGTAVNTDGKLPIVHILIPDDFRVARGPMGASTSGNVAASYTWEGIEGGLDGIAIDIPALNVKPLADGLIPLNIQVKDPIWPERDLLDISISVKPGEARTVFLDTRDRILPDAKSLYLTIASAGADFNAKALDGMNIRLKFKPRKDALAEHIADRFGEARDNMAFMVEEHTNTKRLARFARFDAEILDVLRVDPENQHAREMWYEYNPEQTPKAADVSVPAGVPAWAYLQTEDLKRVRHFVEWWVDNRQVDYGDFGGGISDDVDLTEQWPGVALMGDIPDKLTLSLNRLVDASFRNGMWTNGLSTIKTDELHSYEEGINAIAEAMFLNYGDPKATERLMATAHAYPHVFGPGVDGHIYPKSRYFSGSDISLDGPWAWSHPYSVLILQPGQMLVDYNGSPQPKTIITGIADTYNAKAKPDAKGVPAYPEDLNSQTGESRGSLQGQTRANDAATQIFWASYEWTKDPKYLQIFKSQLAQGSTQQFSYINNVNIIDAIGATKDLAPQFKAQADAGRGSDLAVYNAWRNTGDVKYLERAFNDEINDAERRMWMITDAHWWSDRVDLSTFLLQRTRLGGGALIRNRNYQGNTVSWRFDTPTAAESVGILVSDNTPDHFKVTAYNLSDKSLHAVMTGWVVTAGQWHVKQVEGGNDERDIAFERTKSTDLTFPAGKQVTWEFTLKTPTTPTNERFDLGIGQDDVVASNGAIKVTVHSLGAKPAPASAVVLEDGSGKELARAATPELAAPIDLLPKTATVTLKTKVKWTSGMRVRVVDPAGQDEVTQMNNVVTAK
ncbi:MAG TPA: LamG-like jellyroll fold domain-containing protein [Asticcacaulis sp.]|nr:LamG-like jellyroll fold domain-containing protein [Asticcacaulis sp.]